MTLNEAIEAAAATVRSLRESAAEDDRYRVLAEDAERDLGWLLELRARRKAMGREPDDERNAAGDLCRCGEVEPRPVGEAWMRHVVGPGDGCPMHPRGGLAHISEALRPLREELARQTAKAQAEVVAELAAMRRSSPGDDLEAVAKERGAAEDRQLAELGRQAWPERVAAAREAIAEAEALLPGDAPPIETGDCGADVLDCPFAAPNCDGCEVVEP